MARSRFVDVAGNPPRVPAVDDKSVGELLRALSIDDAPSSVRRRVLRAYEQEHGIREATASELRRRRLL